MIKTAEKKFGLTPETLNKLFSVFTKYPAISTVILYGSRAKGNYREGSDIDITLVGNELNHHQLLRIMSDIDSLNTPYLFDISIFHEIKNEELIEHINRVGMVLYSKEI